jgi:hypothetical protein
VSKPLPPVTVSNVQLGDQDLRFSVDKIGVPVLVKISYFPNWKVSGAEGPYRIAPNLMVVVPTATDVHLTYGRSQLDYIAYLLTFVGIAMLIVMRIRGDVRHANSHPFGTASDAPEFQWDDWEPRSEPVLADPTPSQMWQPDVDVPLDTDLTEDSLVWAAPRDPPDDSGPLDASL